MGIKKISLTQISCLKLNKKMIFIILTPVINPNFSQHGKTYILSYVCNFYFFDILFVKGES